VLQCLPSKCEALSSNHSNTKPELTNYCLLKTCSKYSTEKYDSKVAGKDG
jgi:hypothetical protein